ncbi:ABC-type glycerol-3-phosphate transport system substrate-binding protein [Rubricella aquisinus]|uniref:ABC-type glycerol-3-phosphate transport system substrate-binding protein n=1 Tax=Rubricella aquisinus TaxID=2028108 RepID=A0A840WHU3_9RHOB|nr:extracellular solute-binding protein [Rubricella aquisinus]MBB5514698.1 ABC-type glycerol-3-phosphate transport system substrate-binding protein [Rubricella aquisinus]
MKLRSFALAAAMAVIGTGAYADCAFENTTTVKSLTAGFEAWKAVTDAMAECGNVEAELDQEFRQKQPEAFAANPSLYHIGGVANSTMVPLLNAGTIRPLDDLVAQYGQDLSPNQLIRVDGQIYAIAMMVNAQHLMYRADILAEHNLDVPTTWDEVLETAEYLRSVDAVEYPLGATMKTGWNLAQDFVNMYLGHGGTFFVNGVEPNVNNEAGMGALEMMKAMTAYMDPEYLVSDSTYVQQQFQQGKIAMANLWASRAGAMDDAAESSVVGLVEMAAAPVAVAGQAPASTLWWDGIVIASNISDEEAAAAFQVALEGMDSDMVQANNDAAVWLIDGYTPGRLAQGAIATAVAGTPPYPASTQMGLMHTALGNNVADFLTGAKDATATLEAIEADYMTAAKEAGLL